MIKQIDYKEAVEFLLPRHYSGRIPTIVYAFGEFTEGGSSLLFVRLVFLQAHHYVKV